MDHLCYLCLVSVVRLRLFIAAFWSPAGKGLSSCLSFVMFNCVFVTFPCGILGQVWYLIVSIPDLCQLSNFASRYRFFIIIFLGFHFLQTQSVLFVIAIPTTVWKIAVSNVTMATISLNCRV